MDYIPVRVLLSSIKDDEKFWIYALNLEDEDPVVAEQVIKEFLSKNLVLLLDGLDELAKNQVLSKIGKGNFKIIISTRVNHIREWKD